RPAARARAARGERARRRGAGERALSEIPEDGQLRHHRDVMRPERIWESVPCDEAAITGLAASLDISRVTARLLCQRGFADADRARRFLSPSLDDLHDPFGLADMATAVERILGAIARQERVAIHGDYDV